MIRTRWFQFGRLIFAKSAEIRGVAFVLASALLAPSTFAGDQVGGSTVFRNVDGSEWAVAVRPAVKTARATQSTVLVPPPPEESIQTAAGVETDSATKLRAPSLPSTVIAAAAQVDQPAVSPPVPFETTSAAQPANEFGITVTPGGPRKLTILGRSYNDAYRSIPYRRAEYLANPGYRHDAAMELLFGQMRPTTVVKQMPEGALDQPTEQAEYPRIITPSEYWSYPRFGWPYFSGAYYGAPYFGSSYSAYPRYPSYGSPTGCIWP